MKDRYQEYVPKFIPRSAPDRRWSKPNLVERLNPWEQYYAWLNLRAALTVSQYAKA